MSLEGTGANATATLGADIIGTPATFTLANMAASWPTSGLVHVNITDTEIISGTISGSTVTVVTRAVEPIGAFSTAQNHTAGDSVKLILAYTALKNMFPYKADEKSGAGASYVFNTFPSTGFALEIIYGLRDDTAGTTNSPLKLRFNGDTGANYTSGELYNSSATVAAYFEETAQTTARAGILVNGGATANYFGQGRILIPNYAGALIKQGMANTFTAFGSGGGGTTSRQVDFLWASTAAITSVTLLPPAGNFAANSYARLIIHP